MLYKLFIYNIGYSFCLRYGLRFRQTLGMQSQFIDNILWHTERGIDGLEAGISQKGEASDTEECMEYVGHVACAIGEAACLCILAGENELLQLLGTDPVQTTHNGQ